MKKWKQFPSIVAKRRNAKAPDRYCRQDISVAELPRSRRATAQSERMVRDPKVASNVAQRRIAKAPDRYYRQDISAAELPRSRRATAQSERMVRDPKVADNFHTMNASKL